MKAAAVDAALPGHFAHQEARRLGDLALGDGAGFQPATLLEVFRRRPRHLISEVEHDLAGAALRGLAPQA